MGLFRPGSSRTRFIKNQLHQEPNNQLHQEPNNHPDQEPNNHPDQEPSSSPSCPTHHRSNHHSRDTPHPTPISSISTLQLPSTHHQLLPISSNRELEPLLPQNQDHSTFNPSLTQSNPNLNHPHPSTLIICPPNQFTSTHSHLPSYPRDSSIQTIFIHPHHPPHRFSIIRHSTTEPDSNNSTILRSPIRITSR